MGVRQSCPRLGETNAPVSSRMIALAGREALGGDRGGDLEGGFPARFGEDGGGVTRFTTVLWGELVLRGLERLQGWKQNQCTLIDPCIVYIVGRVLMTVL